MGMLDRMKESMDAAKQAQDMIGTPEMQAAMAASQNTAIPSAEEQERVHWYNRVVNEGLDGEATITSIEATGAPNEFRIELEANVGGEPYVAHSVTEIAAKNESYYVPGSKWKIKADPDQKQRVIVLQVIED
jgi:hypothetical protein